MAQISIKKPDGKSITLEIGDGDTVGNLFAKIEDKDANFTTEKYKITLNGEDISQDQDKTLKNLNIGPESNLCLVQFPNKEEANDQEEEINVADDDASLDQDKTLTPENTDQNTPVNENEALSSNHNTENGTDQSNGNNPEEENNAASIKSDANAITNSVTNQVTKTGDTNNGKDDDKSDTISMISNTTEKTQFTKDELEAKLSKIPNSRGATNFFKQDPNDLIAAIFGFKPQDGQFVKQKHKNLFGQSANLQGLNADKRLETINALKAELDNCTKDQAQNGILGGKKNELTRLTNTIKIAARVAAYIEKTAEEIENRETIKGYVKFQDKEKEAEFKNALEDILEKLKKLKTEIEEAHKDKKNWTFAKNGFGYITDEEEKDLNVLISTLKQKENTNNEEAVTNTATATEKGADDKNVQNKHLEQLKTIAFEEGDTAEKTQKEIFEALNQVIDQDGKKDEVIDALIKTDTEECNIDEDAKDAFIKLINTLLNYQFAKDAKEGAEEAKCITLATKLESFKSDGIALDVKAEGDNLEFAFSKGNIGRNIKGTVEDELKKQISSNLKQTFKAALKPEKDKEPDLNALQNVLSALKNDTLAKEDAAAAIKEVAESGDKDKFEKAIKAQLETCAEDFIKNAKYKSKENPIETLRQIFINLESAGQDISDMRQGFGVATKERENLANIQTEALSVIYSKEFLCIQKTVKVVSLCIGGNQITNQDQETRLENLKKEIASNQGTAVAVLKAIGSFALWNDLKRDAKDIKQSQKNLAELIHALNKSEYQNCKITNETKFKDNQGKEKNLIAELKGQGTLPAGFTLENEPKQNTTSETDTPNQSTSAVNTPTTEQPNTSVGAGANANVQHSNVGVNNNKQQENENRDNTGNDQDLTQSLPDYTPHHNGNSLESSIFDSNSSTNSSITSSNPEDDNPDFVNGKDENLDNTVNNQDQSQQAGTKNNAYPVSTNNSNTTHTTNNKTPQKIAAAGFGAGSALLAASAIVIGLQLAGVLKLTPLQNMFESIGNALGTDAKTAMIGSTAILGGIAVLAAVATGLLINAAKDKTVAPNTKVDVADRLQAEQVSTTIQLRKLQSL